MKVTVRSLEMVMVPLFCAEVPAVLLLGFRVASGIEMGHDCFACTQ